MISFRRSIYWKLLFTFLASLTIASLVVSIMFLFFTPTPSPHEMNPQIKNLLIRETQKIADQVALRLQNSSTPLENIVKEFHEKDNANIRVFDIQGNELAACMEERLKKAISEERFEDAATLRDIIRSKHKSN